MQDIFQIRIKLDHKPGMFFNYNGTAISWRSVKQTMVATSSNHSEILAIHEASRECIWLRSMIHHIQESCGLSFIKDKPTILFEDNAACIAQIKGGYIKGDRTKHISPKIFYAHELQKNGEIDVQQIRSSDNLTDLFTKALPTSTFKKLIYKVGMRKVKDVDMRGSMTENSVLHSFFLRPGFVPLGFTSKVFNEAVLIKDLFLMVVIQGGVL